MGVSTCVLSQCTRETDGNQKFTLILEHSVSIRPT
ncbi:mCG147480 [Mus musculus]|nr:mCG147480 [Mus musculus]